MFVPPQGVSLLPEMLTMEEAPEEMEVRPMAGCQYHPIRLKKKTHPMNVVPNM